MNTSFVLRHSAAIFAAIGFVVLCAGPVAAEEQDREAAGQGPTLIALAPEKPETTLYDLQYKLQRGDVLRYEVTHRAAVQSTIEGTTQSAETKTDSVKVWKVTDVLPGGDIEFMNVVERVRMVNQLPDRKAAEYDSEKDKTPPPGFEDAARSIGVPLSVVRVTPTGKVVRRDAKVKDQNVEDDAPIVVRLPERPIAIGETWDELFDVQVMLEGGGTKAIQTRRRHKLANVSNGVATIEVTYQVLSPIDAVVESQLVQRVMEGEVRFDIEAGRVIGQQMEVDKRILGFAGPTSSMQYKMRMEEKLLKIEPKVATRPVTKPAVKPATKPTPKPAAKPIVKSARQETPSSTRPQPPTPPRTAKTERTTPETRPLRR